MRQIAKAREKGREIDRDTAFEEVVADSMETMLSQGDIGQMMAELKQKDKTLWEKVREWFRNLADSLKVVADEYRGAKPESPEGRLVAQMDDFVKVLQQAYAEALVEAGENYRANEGNKKTTREGGAIKSDRYNISQEESLAKQERFYSWDFLTALEPMKTVTLPEVSDIKGDDNKVNKALVVDLGMKNAEKVGFIVDGKVFVANNYTGRRIRIDHESIRHSLNGDYRRLLTNSRMGAVIGEIVQNAVPINGRTDTAQNVLGTYSMAIYTTDSKGREFVGIITVEERTGKIESLEYYDVAHAVSGRQKNDSQADTKSQGVDPIKAATISIEDFLSVVKSTHQSILSKSVLQHYGETRNPKGDYANSVLYSDRDAGAEKVAAALEKQNAKLREDVKDLRKLLSMQGKLTHGSEFTKSSIEKEIEPSLPEGSQNSGLNGAPNSSSKIVKDSEAEVKKKFLDRKYISAVEKGDMATAQRMVDKAAKAAGYSMNVYHGTDAKFTEFQKGDLGFHVGSEKQAERRESSNVLSLYASIHKPLSAAFDFGDWHGKYVAEMLVETEQFEDHPDMDSINKRLLEISRMKTNEEADLALRRFLQGMGYDGVVYENAFEGSGESYIAFEANQLKSADPVTYDDAGNVIPLSERFDTTKSDIRYSERDAGAEKVAAALKR